MCDRFGSESSVRFSKLVLFSSKATVQLQAVTSLPAFGWVVVASVCVGGEIAVCSPALGG